MEVNHDAGEVRVSVFWPAEDPCASVGISIPVTERCRQTAVRVIDQVSRLGWVTSGRAHPMAVIVDADDLRPVRADRMFKIAAPAEILDCLANRMGIG